MPVIPAVRSLSKGDDSEFEASMLSYAVRLFFKKKSAFLMEI